MVKATEEADETFTLWIDSLKIIQKVLNTILNFSGIRDHSDTWSADDNARVVLLAWVASRIVSEMRTDDSSQNQML